MKKHTFTCSFFNQLMLITGSHFFWKNPPQACFKITDFIFGPKNHKINAFGSHLYMNLKKNGYLTSIVLMNFHFLVLKSLHAKFGYNGPVVSEKSKL